ncbi:hypothetical protein NIES2107_42250 [Nostoc carneum NIES-2107]|nr:hypothetical protein NIES2107_42250 [Nostoc carneum NIES-2107]
MRVFHAKGSLIKFYPTTVLDRVLHGSKQVQKQYLAQKRRELCMGIGGLMLFLSCYAFKLYISRSGGQESRIQGQRLAWTFDS